MPNLGLPEILIIAVIVILLFGAKKLPDAARSIGRSMRIFKSEVKEMGNDGEPETPQGMQQQAQLPQAQAGQDFWERPENQPNAQQNLQQPPVQPQQPNQQRNPNQPN